MLGLVADEVHGDIHGHRTADSRPDEQGLLGNAELDVIPLGNLFIVDADRDGADRDHDDVSEEDQPKRVDGQVKHGVFSFSCSGSGVYVRAYFTPLSGENYFLALSLRETT